MLHTTIVQTDHFNLMRHETWATEATLVGAVVPATTRHGMYIWWISGNRRLRFPLIILMLRLQNATITQYQWEPQSAAPTNLYHSHRYLRFTVFDASWWKKFNKIFRWSHWKLQEITWILVISAKVCIIYFQVKLLIDFQTILASLKIIRKYKTKYYLYSLFA